MEFDEKQPFLLSNWKQTHVNLMFYFCSQRGIRHRPSVALVCVRLTEWDLWAWGQMIIWAIRGNEVLISEVEKWIVLSGCWNRMLLFSSFGSTDTIWFVKDTSSNMCCFMKLQKHLKDQFRKILKLKLVKKNWTGRRDLTIESVETSRTALSRCTELVKACWTLYRKIWVILQKVMLVPGT